ncbi:hypothetical protein [Granulicoccus sp. GXG6511]|uniref:hypothetical protein n=1 Tax=Granulicoccus sp. GXG6511 TaxID=3381351 RepID=UPI003D7CE814
MADATSLRATPSRILVMLLGVVPLLACAGPADTARPPEHAPPGLVTTPTAAQGPAGPLTGSQLQDFLGVLVAKRADPAAWQVLLDRRDPEFAARADQLRANLAQLEVAITPTGRTHPLSAARRELLGSSATVQAARVDWAVPGFPAATHTVWFTVTTDTGSPRLAGLTDGPSGAVPLWLLQETRVVVDGSDAVLAADDRDAGPWLAGLATARAELRQHNLDPSSLVVQLPDSPADFERVLGVHADSHRAVAASTWPFGETAHIVVNPLATRSLRAEARQVLLTHEAVHVASGSVQRRGLLWLSEGYADLVALSAHPEVRAAHEAHLAADQRRHGIADALVSDADLDPGNPRVDAHYQRAWLTVRVLDRNTGTADRIHAAVQSGAALDQALEDEGWNRGSLQSEVHAELRRLTG